MSRVLGCFLALLLALGAPLTALAASPAPVRYASKVNPYTIAYPAGWRHFSGHLSGNFSFLAFDEYYNPRKQHGFNVNVVVARLPLPSPMTTASYVQQSEANLRAKGLTVREQGTAMLAGRRVPLMEYSDSREHVQAALVTSQQVWVFSLTTARGDATAWRATFVTMLGSVHLR